MEVRRIQLGLYLLQGRFRVSKMADPGRCNGQVVLGAWAKMKDEPGRLWVLWDSAYGR